MRIKADLDWTFNANIEWKKKVEECDDKLKNFMDSTNSNSLILKECESNLELSEKARVEVKQSMM